MTGNSTDQGHPEWPRFDKRGPEPTDVRELIEQAIGELDPPVRLRATAINYAGKVAKALLANAYQHTTGSLRRDTVRLVVQVDLIGGERALRVVVHDPGEVLDLDWSKGGSGFWTVRQFASLCGVERDGEAGKVVWTAILLDRVPGLVRDPHAPPQ
ncbi:hypothetical protein ACQPZP_04335 [Spirillospora sp. CA-142024]|uniref:hypothetical protein n=1 Tax=Spirillospora sp. CA-142024 TaxID=3240036 RepID=UPI003D8F875E